MTRFRYKRLKIDKAVKGRGVFAHSAWRTAQSSWSDVHMSYPPFEFSSRLFTVLVCFYFKDRVYTKSPVLQIYFEGNLILHELSRGAWEPTHIDPCAVCSFLGDHVEVEEVPGLFSPLTFHLSPFTIKIRRFQWAV